MLIVMVAAMVTVMVVVTDVVVVIPTGQATIPMGHAQRLYRRIQISYRCPLKGLKVTFSSTSGAQLCSLGLQLTRFVHLPPRGCTYTRLAYTL